MNVSSANTQEHGPKMDWRTARGLSGLLSSPTLQEGRARPRTWDVVQSELHQRLPKSTPSRRARHEQSCSNADSYPWREVERAQQQDLGQMVTAPDMAGPATVISAKRVKSTRSQTRGDREQVPQRCALLPRLVEPSGENRKLGRVFPPSPPPSPPLSPVLGVSAWPRGDKEKGRDQTPFVPFPALTIASYPFPSTAPVPFQLDPPPTPLYSCTAIVPLLTSKTAKYMTFPMLELHEGDTVQVLYEAGHPSEHALPVFVDEDDDCLLLARDENDRVGWALASFLAPIP